MKMSRFFREAESEVSGREGGGLVSEVPNPFEDVFSPHRARPDSVPDGYPSAIKVLGRRRYAIVATKEQEAAFEARATLLSSEAAREKVSNLAQLT